MSLILVSQSPRRKKLLLEKGYHFHTLSVKVSEFIDKNLNLEEALQKVSRQKLEAFIESDNPLKNNSFLALAADTSVILGEKVLGKPQNFDQAFEFLTQLSGKTHEVWTSVCFYESSTKIYKEFLDKTQIEFKNLSDFEKKTYIETGDPYDKAGGYGIQNIQEKFVISIQGSYSNVVGLPIERVEQCLKENEWLSYVQ